MFFHPSIQSTSIGDSVYECDWLEGDLTSKKFLLFIILRSRRPVCLRAETFSIVSLKNFSSVRVVAGAFVVPHRSPIPRPLRQLLGPDSIETALVSFSADLQHQLLIFHDSTPDLFRPRVPVLTRSVVELTVTGKGKG